MKISAQRFGVILLLSASAVQAQVTFTGNSQTLPLKGTITQACGVGIAPITAASQALNLIAGATALSVADISVGCNNATGIVVTLKSANLGQLKNPTASGSEATVAYTLTPSIALGLTPDSASSSTWDTQPGVKYVSAGFLPIATGNLLVTIPARAANSSLAAGDFTDTVTVEVAAKPPAPAV